MPTPRPSINVQMTCCRVYVKLYLRADRSAFAGHCPKCSRPVVVPVSNDGSTSKFFQA